MYRETHLPAWAALLLLTTNAAFATEAVLGSAPQPRVVTLDDMSAIKSPSTPKLSRDGRQVAYELDGQIYIVPTTGGIPRAVTSAGSSASDPLWSKDARSLYFLSDRAEKYQLWKLPIDTFGEATQLTEFDRGIDALNLSPDETQLLISIRGKYEAAGGKEKAQPAIKTPEPFVVTRLHFKEDAGDGYITGDRARHLYVYDLKTKQLRQVTSGDFSESDASWSPDGKTIVFESNREKPDATYSTDLWTVAAGNQDLGQSLTRLTKNDRVNGSPKYSPDGRLIAYITAEDGVYGLQRVAVIPATGGEPRVLTQGLDRWVNDFLFSGDGEWIYIVYENLGGTDVARVRVRDGKLENLLEGGRQIDSVDVAANGTLVARVQAINDAPEIHSFAKGRATRLTTINDEYLRTVMRATREKVEFKSPDGTLVEAFVTRPPGFVQGQKYPTMLHIHGGPVGQFSYGYDFANEYLAANGYVIVEPNPRGSTGRGQDFVRAIYQTWGITDYDDVIAAVDHVIKLGIADPEKLVVYGYSYGGYMTNTVITRTNRFKAAVSGAGHSLIAANFGHDIYQKWYRWELGVPWENNEKYERLSPLLQVGKVQTPTLFVGGRDDWNVPVINAELFFQSLKTRGIDTQLVVYPGTHHGGWSDDFEKDRLVRTRDWFDKHLGLKR
jgi:dipeptidyl aminopeptidase/acylaminoacyl peptidase